MDINVMVVSVGNSRVAIGTFVAGELKYTSRVPNDRGEEWRAALADAWKLIAGSEGAAVCGASVNPAMDEAVESAVLDVANRAVQWVGEQVDLPIDVLTEEPEKTGVDRVLNVAAAYEQMGKACIVVDAGTAITIDCCNDKGQFVGGAIAAGASTMLRALHERTAQLPAVEFEVPKKSIGGSTEAAMISGVYYGIRGMVKEIAENYATELGQWPEIIATGGDARKLFEGWELIHAVSPDLTFYGIALAYVNHHIKHDAGEA